MTNRSGPPFDARGGALWLSREEWGVVLDALIEHQASAGARKEVNTESTSDVRAVMCADLIRRITERCAECGDAATPQVLGTHAGTALCECPRCFHQWERPVTHVDDGRWHAVHQTNWEA